MNLNGDEKRIRQLFREMSRDDQRRAPQFASVLAAARSGMARSQNRTRSLRFAMAVAMLCAALLIAMAIIVRPSKPTGPARDEQAVTPTVPPEAPSKIGPKQPGVGTPGLEPRRVIIKRVRHHRTTDQLAVAMNSLFAWRSPTASLLKTPGDELLRSLPRLGESLQTIKSFSPDQFN
jgi:hypothetical protein